MKTRLNLWLVIPLAAACASAAAGLLLGAYAIGRRRRGPWLIERGTP